ncbi:MAG TPA: helix-turn-helix transcriptional regulator [Anaeromyxobacter sp.]|nr:helix-turn-helix transcriptional regulator [Anaeromyxobacter sp.]
MDPHPEPKERAARVAAFSTWLARERELRGLSRDQVVRSTRLAPAVVEALEAGEPDRLPPRAYALGYLRAYAGAVGLDPDEVVLRYEEAAIDPASGPGEPRRRLTPRLVLAALFVGLSVGAALWVWLRG